MKGQAIERPSPEEMAAALAEHGSINAYAAALGRNESTVRRWVLNAGLKAPKPAAAKPAPGSPVSREEVLEQRLKEAEKQLAEARAEDVREARVLGALEASVQRVVPSYRPGPRRRAADGDGHTLVLLWSDCHASEVVSPVETLGLNAYNWDIMQARLRRLADGVRSHRDHYGTKARHLVICSLGDQLTGVIHEELAQTNDTTFSDSMVRFGEEGAQWIVEEFGDVFDRIDVHVIPGNHPRFSKKPRHKLSYDNGDYVAGHIMRIALRNTPNVTVNVPRANKALIEVCGRRILLMHGDGVRSTMVGVPWGGIMRRSERLKALFDLVDEKPDHIFCGHFHTAEIADDFSIVVNGSLKGVDEYGIDEHGGGKPPVQLLAAFHPKRGVTGVHKIDCISDEERA